ncbi:hypothetical protein AC623_07190 [Bacillus sp. FJAT-27231]|uniref:hypothetical protein n=1 Tax=Bacillus sp. FJAT-27231 TaxID=1679168 RepID=UPI000670C8D1|nr:hypothetical protein [Bacillus sp. FJAT-27231]KMY53783.1 hypothetical protein AC623_07190 [Bacillus sp. FJAT-27231]
MNDLFIQKIVEEVLKQVQKESIVHSKPSILVIHPGTEMSKEQVKELRKYWEVTEVSLTTEKNMNLPPSVTEAVFLEASQTLMVKGALGIADTAESEWLSNLLLHGVKTYIVPDQQLSFLLHDKVLLKARNRAYQQMFLTYRETLSSFGVFFNSLEELVQAGGRNEKKSGQSEDNIFHEKLISQKVIESWNGREIKVLPGSIVTPLAKDLAKQKGIKIFALEE